MLDEQLQYRMKEIGRLVVLFSVKALKWMIYGELEKEFGTYPYKQLTEFRMKQTVESHTRETFKRSK
jgi:hypothetical protein